MVTSFQIDHTKLKEGIYMTYAHESYTYDFRFVAPVNAKVQTPTGRVLHTLEHCIADYLRSKTSKEFSFTVQYIGFGGCRTCLYILCNKGWPSRYIQKYLTEACEYILSLTEIPGATELECGYADFHDLEGAKRYVSMRLLPILKEEKEPLASSYPRIAPKEYPKKWL